MFDFLKKFRFTKTSEPSEATQTPPPVDEALAAAPVEVAPTPVSVPEPEPARKRKLRDRLETGVVDRGEVQVHILQLREPLKMLEAGAGDFRRSEAEGSQFR